MTAGPARLVVLDAGTGGVRAHVVDEDGRLETSASRPLAVAMGGGGRAEMDPGTVWAGARDALREVLARTGTARLAAVGLASALGYLLVDGAGRPLGPAMLWMDRRARDETEALARRLDPDRLYRITGRRLDPEILLPKLLWLRRHEPDRLAMARGFVGLKDDLVRRLTGTVGTDPVHAAYTMLYDVERRDWSDEILEAAGLGRALLPALRPATAVAGRVTGQAAAATGLPEGLPVAAGTSDGTTACIAAGLDEPGTAVNVTGTTDVLMIASSRPAFDPARRTLVNPHPVADGWMVGAVMGTTGATLAWFADRFCAGLEGPDRHRALDAEAARSGTGARGLLCLTGLAGERAPLWDPDARGVVFGLGLTHDRGDVARAILEGVALGVRNVTEILGALGVDVRRLRVVGGGAASDLWNQIRADATGLVVERPCVVEGTATGAALVAGLAVGLHDGLATAALRAARIERTWAPDPALAERYAALARRRLALYEAVRGLFAAPGAGAP